VNDRPERAVFLDRDGTIIADVGYLTDVEQIRILPGVPQALAALKRAGFLLVVVTNQSAVARGWLTEERLAEVHEALQQQLVEAGGPPLDAFYHCPHLPEGTVAEYARECDCRKPAPGLLIRAAAQQGVDLQRSCMVGDSERDVEAGRRAGCFTVLVGGGDCPAADATAADMAGACDLILARERPSP